MLIINLKSTDPSFNLAVDEYLLKKREEDFLVIYVNERSVIIGKHQVAHRETDTRFAFEHSIPVIRRISGGGTVYHDRGNLNFSFIMNTVEGKQVDFRKYSAPVIGFLETIGVNATFGGKNDLQVGGYKISGNAEHVFRNRVLHHGTLLYSADFETLHGVLRKDTSKYQTRAVRSNPSPVANLGDIINHEHIHEMNDLRREMLNWFLINNSGSYEYDLTDAEVKLAEELAYSKYNSWEWNYAYGPEYRVEIRFSALGKEDFCILTVKDGVITDCEAETTGIFSTISRVLPGCRHMPDDLAEVFEKEDFFIRGINALDFF